MAKTRNQKAKGQGGEEHSSKKKKKKQQQITKESMEKIVNEVLDDDGILDDGILDDDDRSTETMSTNSNMNKWIDALKAGPGTQQKDQNQSGINHPGGNDGSLGGNLTPTIELDDIVEEICYWESAMICYVLGANPPIKVMEGFAHRMWKNNEFDKIIGIGKGVYLARFHNKENMLKICNGEHMFFDSKPLITKPWSPDIDVMKEDIKSIPLWIKLPCLDLKYWGVKALTKICSGVGKLVQLDNSTLNKDKLNFARILVETEVDSPLPETVKFVNEKGVVVNQMVEYDWKPVHCNNCKGFGHDTKKCNKVAVGRTVKRWIPKTQQQPLLQQKQQPTQQEEEGFVTVTRKGTSPTKHPSPTNESISMANKFGTLERLTDKETATVDDTNQNVRDLIEVSATSAHGGVDTPKEHG